MRYDLSFFLCCCKSFLGSSSKKDEENFYALLQIDSDASPDEIKRAYKQQSLIMHPDKLAQKGLQPTPEDHLKFTRMKEAYEVLSDPHKRETYDAIGERGMKWLDEPFSIDPQELAHNFATSSVLDRSKIFLIFVGIAVTVLLQPILICLHVDGAFGEDANWMATLTPLWIWNVFILIYHSRVIGMGPIPKPDHVPADDWIDPLPMQKRILSCARFILLFLFELLAALKLDQVVFLPWTFIFVPLYVWEVSSLYKKLPLARMRIVTVEDLEAALGKPFSQFSFAEKELIANRYSVVPSTESAEFLAAQKLKTRARHDIVQSMFRIAFCACLLVRLDLHTDWSWWIVFLPLWVMMFLICYTNWQAFAEVQRKAHEKDPNLFVPSTDNGASPDVEAGYGAVATDGTATSEQTQQQAPKLSDQEKEELRAQVVASSSKLCSKCCSLGFILIVVVLFVAKLQGAHYSAVWIISPFLLVIGLILFILGCAIFGISEVPTDGIDFDFEPFGTDNSRQQPNTVYAATDSPTMSDPVYIPPPPPTNEKINRLSPMDKSEHIVAISVEDNAAAAVVASFKPAETSDKEINELD
ncbi:hypothetical protein MPSEU_000577000 [Mayamaea pseudoterrestris]|nr:hypothetical protein MPSEU_000577000 [Mayamaea pseudoterrestris]